MIYKKNFSLPLLFKYFLFITFNKQRDIVLIPRDAPGDYNNPIPDISL